MEVWRRFFVIRTISEVFSEYVIAILKNSLRWKILFVYILIAFDQKCYKTSKSVLNPLNSFQIQERILKF